MPPAAEIKASGLTPDQLKKAHLHARPRLQPLQPHRLPRRQGHLRDAAHDRRHARDDVQARTRRRTSAGRRACWACGRCWKMVCRKHLRALPPWRKCSAPATTNRRCDGVTSRPSAAEFRVIRALRRTGQRVQSVRRGKLPSSMPRSQRDDGATSASVHDERANFSRRDSSALRRQRHESDDSAW